MTTWEVVMQALARMKPKARDRAWLQKELGVSTQAITNWKSANEIPPGRYMQICDLLGLTAEQLTGRAPLPWEMEGWPFGGIDQARFYALTPSQRKEIEAIVLDRIEQLERGRSSGGGSSGSSRAPQQRNAA